MVWIWNTIKSNFIAFILASMLGPLKIPDYFRVGGKESFKSPTDEDDIKMTDAEESEENADNCKLKRFVSHTDLSQLSQHPGSRLVNWVQEIETITLELFSKIIKFLYIYIHDQQ